MILFCLWTTFVFLVTAKPKKKKVSFILPTDSDSQIERTEKKGFRPILRKTEIITSPPPLDEDEDSRLALALFNSILNKSNPSLSFDSVRDPSPEPPPVTVIPESHSLEEIHSTFTFTKPKKKSKSNSENQNPFRNRLKSQAKNLPKFKLQYSIDIEGQDLREPNSRDESRVLRPNSSVSPDSSDRSPLKTNLFGPRLIKSTNNRPSPKFTDTKSDTDASPFSKFGVKLRDSQESHKKFPRMADAQNADTSGRPDPLTPNMRDDIREKDILIWIYNMIDEPARVDFEFFLKDGCILCKLMNRINPGCIPEEDITWEGAKSKQKNISMFLRAAEDYGVPQSKLFHMEDLLQLRHIPRVTRCIYALANIAQDDPALGPDCPRLGDEPSFVTATKKPDVPGHRDTKDVMNQIEHSFQKGEERPKLMRNHSLYQ